MLVSSLRPIFSCFRNVVNGLKQLKSLTYCRKTKWVYVTFQDSPCLQCQRIRRTRLTLDGIRLKLKGQFVDKKKEEAKMRQLYYSRSRRHLQL